jgi:arabinofuranosyltransferase
MRRTYAFFIAGIGTSFVAWASLFIYRSSFVGIDGKRYFCLFDDAMISMRYAWNFSHGIGLVWNSGEYVEGYSNPLMTLLMSLSTLVFNKVEAVLAIQILGIIFMLVNAYLIVSIAKHLVSGLERYRSLFLALAFVSALSYYPLLYWSLMGMETGLLAVLLSLSVLFALKYAEDRRPALAIFLFISLGLAFLTRMDTVVFAVPIFVYAFYGRLRTDRSTKSLSFLFAMGGLYALFVMGQELLRWSYYGEWLPNTYSLKVSGIAILTRIINGMDFVVPFLTELYIPLIIAGVATLFAFRKEKLLLVSVFATLVCYQVWAGGDPWEYWRMLSPAVPILLVVGTHEILRAMQAVFASEGFQRYSLRNPIIPRRYVPVVVVCLLVGGMLWSVNSRFLPEIAMLQKAYDTEFNENRINTALAIEQVTASDATVGVFGAGTIPYYSGRPAIDFLGKTDRRIARVAPEFSGMVSGNESMVYEPGHNKFDLEYSIKELKPTYVEGFRWHGQNVVGWAKSEYVSVKYEGVPLYLLKDSEDVHWADIDGPLRRVRAKITTFIIRPDPESGPH